MVTDEEVLAFFCEELSIPLTWKFKKIPLGMDTLLQDYAEGDELPYAIEKYSEVFGVDVSVIDMRHYFPWENLTFMQRLAKGRKEKEVAISARKPLTVRMFAESAKAGRWLYD